MKKILSLVLVVSTAFMLFVGCNSAGTSSVGTTDAPSKQQVTKEVDESEWAYVITDNKAVIHKYVGQDSSVVIPSELGGSPVTEIGERTFQERWKSVTSITIPDGITTIGYYAFGGCVKVKNFTIPNSVTEIGDYAFSTCKGLTSITIPDSVTTIGESAFQYCESLTSVTIPNGVTEIKHGTFGECANLTNVTIPDSVTTIGGYAFGKCSSLTSITIPDSVTTIGPNAFFLCSSLTRVMIPDSVTSIADDAFSAYESLTIYTESESLAEKLKGLGLNSVYDPSKF